MANRDDETPAGIRREMARNLRRAFPPVDRELPPIFRTLLERLADQEGE